MSWRKKVFTRAFQRGKEAVEILRNGWFHDITTRDHHHDPAARFSVVEIGAVYDRYSGRNRLMSADALARAVSLDMADWWRPTQAGFLDRVTKDHIVQAVTEGVSVQAARYLPDLKKSQMSAKAEKLLADSRWIPEPLRTSTLSGDSANEASAAIASE